MVHFSINYFRQKIAYVTRVCTFEDSRWSDPEQAAVHALPIEHELGLLGFGLGLVWVAS